MLALLSLSLYQTYNPAKRLKKRQPLSKLSSCLFVDSLDLFGELAPEAGRLDLVADQEVVHQEADPAEGDDGDGEEYLEEGLELVVLEDVEHAPDGGDDAEDVNDSCNHNVVLIKGVIISSSIVIVTDCE